MNAQSLTYAAQRSLTVLMAASSVIGLMFMVLVLGPVAEVRYAYPVATWEIVNAQRIDGKLTWYVLVDKRRDCAPTIVWHAVWNRETRVLRPVILDGEPVTDRQVIQAGKTTVLGPLEAAVPKGWEQSEGIEIDALAKYDCGSPWPLPPLDVRPVVAR